MVTGSAERRRRLDDQIAWEMAAGSALFLPTMTGKVAGWLRLAVSDQASGEWTPSIVDVLNPANPVTQTDTDRRCAVGASANGYPTMVFDGTDMHVWPLDNAINNMATKLGFWFWVKPATVSGAQRHVNIDLAAGVASASKLTLYQNNATLVGEYYVNNVLGRVFTTGNVLSAGAWYAVYWRYDSSLGGDANVALYVNGTLTATTPAAIGAGDDNDLTVLPQPTGNCILGAYNNADAPVQPLDNASEFGPNLFALNDTLTAGEIAAIYAFERPT